MSICSSHSLKFHCEIYFLVFLIFHKFSFLVTFSVFLFLCVPILSAVFPPVLFLFFDFFQDLSSSRRGSSVSCVAFFHILLLCLTFSPLLASVSCLHTLPDLAHKCSAQDFSMKFCEKRIIKKLQIFPSLNLYQTTPQASDLL